MANPKCKMCGTRHREGSKVFYDHMEAGVEQHRYRQSTKADVRGYRKSKGMSAQRSQSPKFGAQFSKAKKRRMGK